MNNTLAKMMMDTKKKGQYFLISYTSDVTLSKKAKMEGHTAVKVTERLLVRCGIKNAHRKVVKQRLAAGEAPKPRSWGEMMPNSDRILHHTDKTGQYKQYAVVYPASPEICKTFHCKPTVYYKLDGKRVTLDELKASGLVLESYFKNYGERPEILTINLANIDKIG